MLDPQGAFVPYPYAMRELVDFQRYAIELGSLQTPAGQSPYSIVRMKPFVCVLPIVEAGTPNARLVLVRQYRYAVDGWQFEPPAGGIEQGEEPEHAALRELREESGLLVDELQGLGWVYPSAGSTSEKAYMFAARCSRTRVSTELDKGEQIETVYASRTEMEELLLRGGNLYAHAVTYAAWLRFAASGLLDAWLPDCDRPQVMVG